MRTIRQNYWPFLALVVLMSLLWLVTGPTPEGRQWLFWAGRATQVIILAAVFFSCRANCRMRRELERLKEIRKQMVKPSW
jgi:integral membrane sensor domain MASE1